LCPTQKPPTPNPRLQGTPAFSPADEAQLGGLLGLAVATDIAVVVEGAA
jgi:hypothetical protein